MEQPKRNIFLLILKGLLRLILIFSPVLAITLCLYLAALNNQESTIIEGGLFSYFDWVTQIAFAVLLIFFFVYLFGYIKNKTIKDVDKATKNRNSLIWNILATILIFIQMFFVGGILSNYCFECKLLHITDNIPNYTRAFDKKADDSQANADGIASVAKANNEFSFNLYEKIKDGKNNQFFSPFSISSALAMVYEGASGQTADEIDSVFGFPKDDLTRRSSFAKLYNNLNGNIESFNTVSIANALWVDKNYPILSDYKNIIDKYYLGKTTNLDFAWNNNGSLNIINSWVENQTNGKIKNLFSSLDANTRVVLTDAIYFKGKWLNQFKTENTKPDDFTVSTGTIIKVLMMNNTESYKYTENNKIQAIELPYKGEKLSMVILLPKDKDLSSAEQYLEPKALSDLEKSLYKQKVILYLPKFHIETKYNLNENLSEMGMPASFDGNIADFSKIDGTRKLFIGQVVHKAYVDVDEEGTEAAAATGVGITATAVMVSSPPIFLADHPFVFIIQDNDTGNILFMGNVIQPTSI